MPSSPLESTSLLIPSGFAPAASFGSFSSPSWSESVIFGRDFLFFGCPSSSSESLRIAARFLRKVGEPDLLRELLERDRFLELFDPLRLRLDRLALETADPLLEVNFI